MRVSWALQTAEGRGWPSDRSRLPVSLGGGWSLRATLFLAAAAVFCAHVPGAEAGAQPAFGAPRSEPFVVTQLPAGSGLEKQAPASGGMRRAAWGEGARLVVVGPDRSTRVLSEGFHSACDPEVSFDAQRILFAGKKLASDPWSIFEMALDGSGARQITRDLGDCRSPGYQSTLYTIISPKPWYQLTFVSTGAGTLDESGSTVATHLYSCKLDGSAVRQLTFNLSSDMDPFLMADGRLLFASWQRSTLRRGLAGRVALFGINIDGADCALFAGDQGRRVRHMPCTTTLGLAVFVESDEVPWDGAGCLSCVSLRRPLHSYRQITREADGLFLTPSPLPDGSLLVSRRPQGGGGTHGVYQLDPGSGECRLVFDDPRYHDIQARLVHPRPEPDGRSSVVTEEDPHGKLYCLSVTVSDLQKREWMPPGTARRLRVLEGVPLRARDAGADPPGSAANGLPPLAQRRVLGEIDLGEDGSFHVEVPANTPIELQILDADGLALRSCGWVWAKNHEPRGCIGCHEDGELTPENQFQSAFEGPSALVCPPEEQRRTVDFRRDLMPIIDGKCVPCHGRDGAAPRLDGGLELVARPGGKGRFNHAYESLLALEGSGGEASWRGKYVHPGRARTSPLVWHLFGRNTSRGWDGSARDASARPIPPGTAKPLSPGERRAFVEWVDLGAMWDGIPGPDGLPGGQTAGEREKK